jgi:predicted nucleic acid-binding protein
VLVVDTSALAAALLGGAQAPRDRLTADGDLHAPHLLDLEFLQVLRSLVRRGLLTPDRAYDVRGEFTALPIVRYPHQPLNDRIWELRDNLTTYDAAFVALAEALDAPLVTCDGRLASAPGHAAHVELYDPDTR